MITQLYDTSIEVCDVAVMYIEELCTDSAILEKVVQFRPNLDHLGEFGSQLFMRSVFWRLQPFPIAQLTGII